MTRVVVSGAGGRMGRLVCEAIADSADLELAGGFDPEKAGQWLAGIEITANLRSIENAEVVVEFTTPGAVMGNLAEWRRLGLHAVVGTSGFDVPRLSELRRQWGSGPPNCLVVPNFSVGAALMIRMAELAAPHFAAAEVIELHHDRKADAPSGTALSTAARIAEAGGRQERSMESRELVPGARGAEVEGVRIHSVRLPGLLAHQEVLLGSPGETLTIRHDTTDRAAFLPGVLLALRGVASLADPVTVGLQAVLAL
jgi:4-hydroxy-tetrahydrodipicolinate reductase